MTAAAEAAPLAFARAILPNGGRLPAGGERAVAAAREFLGGPGSTGAAVVDRLAQGLDWAARFRTGKPFRALPPEEQEQLLQRWEGGALTRWPLFALSTLLKLGHFDDPSVYEAMGCTWQTGGRAEPERWLSQVRGAADVAATAFAAESVECDVVVIGTGAGGAVVGKELADRGLAVVFIEEGELHRRDAFTGSAIETHKRFYRGRGAMGSVGNTFMPVLMGRMVGGSTAINTATCFRTPDWILDRWCAELGTRELNPERMAPHFARVEQMLQVQTVRPEVLGGAARVLARGCEALGWRHFPVKRNAPDCDGRGVCDFGCPTDAKRSTNVTYVPAALGRGAILYTGFRARRVVIENGRAVGVDAVGRARPHDGDGGGGGRQGPRLRVRARAVVLAGGSIPTPLFLLEQGLCNSSGQVGRNLSLHPATAVSALFDEPVKGYEAVPQGYCCDQFHDDGVLILGASAPPNLGALLFPVSGRRLVDTMEAYDRIASFGVMIEDESRGRVRRGPRGRPLITYFLKDDDVARLHRGMVRLAEIYRAAGARRILPALPRIPILDGDEGLERFRRARLRPWDFLLTSFHPIGTARMGRDPRTSVIGLDHQTHDLPGLFIVDGSAVPGPPAVNPQITIMAMATRAAGEIAERLV